MAQDIHVVVRMQDHFWHRPCPASDLNHVEAEVTVLNCHKDDIERLDLGLPDRPFWWPPVADSWPAIYAATSKPRGRVRCRAGLDSRRGRVWQGLAAGEDVRRPLAEGGQPASPLRMDVGAPGQPTALHGRRDRPVRGVAHDRRVDWHLVQYREHRGMQALVRELNRRYRAQPALWERDFTPDGMRWIDANHVDSNVFSFIRYSADGGRPLVCIAKLAVDAASWIKRLRECRLNS